MYFVYEINGGDDIWVNLVGLCFYMLSDLEEGIEFNEKFSYKIMVENSIFYVMLIW